MTSEKVISMSQAFCKEACDVLCIEPRYFKPEADSVSYCLSGRPTPLRYDMYSKCWLYSKGKDYASAGIPLKMESYFWAMSLGVLKGNFLPLPLGACPEIAFRGVLDKLAADFGFRGDMREIVSMRDNGLCFYKFHLCKEDTENIYQHFYNVKAVSSLGPMPDKGTLDNPFDNVDEAAEYIRKMEDEAWRNDSLLREISEQPYFYDCEQGHFRISWASPRVAHYRNDFPERSFIFNQMDTRFFSLKPNMYRKKFVFRGQSYHYPGKPCVPSLFRYDDHNEESYYLDFLIFSQEMECLISSHPLVRFLDKGFDLLHDKFRIRMNYTGLAQHYYNKSSFLDFSSTLDVAKFFAVTDYRENTDEYTPCHDTSKIGVIYCYELQFPGAFGQHKGYGLRTIGKQVFMRSGAQSGLLLEMDKGVDLNHLPEVRKIYFRHVPEISDRIFLESGKGSMYFGEDLLQHAWYDRFRNRAENLVVSSAAVDLNYSLNSKRETREQIIANLKRRNISVDDHVPRFSEEELEMYRESVKRGWWEEFCSDLHFYGPEDELYLDELRRLPLP